MSILRLYSKFFSVFKRKINMDGVTFASFMSRYLTIVIDLFVMYIILRVIASITGLLSFSYMPSLEAIERYRLGIDLLPGEMDRIRRYVMMTYVTHGIEFIVMYAFCVISWMKFGGSPAKLCMGMRIVDRSTLRFVSFKQANRRFFSYPLSLLPLGIGIMWGAVDKKGQMLHDKLGGTVVIYKINSKEPSDPFDIFLDKCMGFAHGVLHKFNKPT